MSMIGRLLKNRRAGEASLAWHREGLEAPDTIELASPGFEDGHPLPRRNAGKGIGDNLSPALAWAGVPVATRQLVLIVEDPDVPLRAAIVHAVATDLEGASGTIAEGDLNAGSRHGSGRGSFGRVGYEGPRPIPGHGPHAYVFQLFALDSAIDVTKDMSPAQLMQRMRGHVIARGRLTGTYER
jgi:Raf kinase inhibitor-like YbhB/YbcL family protein